MAQMGRPGLSSQQKRELWVRWKAGQSLSDIGRGLGKHAGSIFGVLLSKGGIAPPARIRSRRSLLCTNAKRYPADWWQAYRCGRLRCSSAERRQRSAARSVGIMDPGSIGRPMLMSELGDPPVVLNSVVSLSIHPCRWWLLRN